jgi:pyroglutamyl-peptidase
MLPRILLTSFDIWKPHHITNASDDLLAELLVRNHITENMHLIRKLPVDFELAPQQVIAKMNDWQPDIVICCGMAEKRSHLSLEANGKQAEQTLHTSISLHALLEPLSGTVLSHDAGKFVCNHLYYAVLKYIQDHDVTSSRR